MSSVPHECPPAGRRCFDCNPRMGVEHTGELPAWMERPIGSERPTPVPYASRPAAERIDALRAELRRVVDEAIRTAPESALGTDRVGWVRRSAAGADADLERLAFTLTRLHESDSALASVGELDETQRGPRP